LTLQWEAATVTFVKDETPHAKTFRLALREPSRHRAGQHYVVQLTAPDGYTATRSYSVASAPDGTNEIELTVERLEGGEVSPFLHEVVVPGDRLELRGPIGGYFVWDAALGGPLLLVAGGSGVVPLMAMARHRARSAMSIPTRLLFSSRTYEEIIYRDELDRLSAAGDGFEVLHTLTRQQPEGWNGFTRRIDEAMLAEALEPLGAATRVYACGPTALVEVVANSLVQLGLPPDRIRTERFGPTGT
jgi:ferredoxin-NADP reductase